MIAGLIFGLYGVGAYWTARAVARPILDDLYGDRPVGRSDRWVVAFLAMALGLLWPGVLPAWALRKSMDGLKSTHEVRQEDAKLRKFAREHGLPWPGSEDER